MKGNLIALVSSVALTVSALPCTSLSVLAADEQNVVTKKDGYTYTFWNQNSAGMASMKNGSDGCFEASWMEVKEAWFLAGIKAKNNTVISDYNALSCDYEMDFESIGNSYFGINGWLLDEENNPTEFYIIDGWGSEQPLAIRDDVVGTVESDGGQYTLYTVDMKEQPSVAGNTSFRQYWSVRTENALGDSRKGTVKSSINIKNHLDAMQKIGMPDHPLNQVGLCVDALGSDGAANVSKNDIVLEIKETPGTTTQYPTVPPHTVTTPLKDAFASAFSVGGEAGDYLIAGGGSEWLYKEFSKMSPQDTMFPNSLLNQQASIANGDQVNPQISLKKADKFLKYCEENNIPVYAKSFLCYSQTPEWLFRENFTSDGAIVSKDIMNQRIDNYIKNVFTALKTDYPNVKLEGFEVAKEFFQNDTGDLRSKDLNKWALIYDDDEYIINAFAAARKYAPKDCKLYYADYNEYMPDKMEGILALLNKLKEQNLIDGMSMEMCVDTAYPDAELIEAAIAAYSELGLDIQFSETTVTDHGNAAERYNQYRDLFALAVKHSDVISAVFLSSDAVYTNPWVWRDSFTADFEKILEAAPKAPASNVLKDVFAEQFSIAAEVAPYALMSDPSLFSKHFDQISIANELYPDAILMQDASQEKGKNVDPQISFENADATLTFCEDNGIALVGSAFVWRSRTPDWFFRENFQRNGSFVSAEVMEQRLENYIKNVFAELKAQYPKLQIIGWEVAKEAFMHNDDTAFEEFSRWNKIYGSYDYLENAYTYARKYAPTDCKLYYGDYDDFQNAQSNIPADLLRFYKPLQEKKLADALDIETIFFGKTAFHSNDAVLPSMEDFENSLKLYADAGIDIRLTGVSVLSTSNEERKTAYTELMKTASKYSQSISAVSFGEKAFPEVLAFDETPALLPIDALIAAFASNETDDTENDDTSSVDTQSKDLVAGDITADGKIDIADAILLSRYCANDTVNVSDRGIKSADTNKDGTLDMNDVTLILQIIARLV